MRGAVNIGHERALGEQTEMRGTKKQDGMKIEDLHRGGLITQRGARGDVDERKEQKKMGREGAAGDKHACYHPSKPRKVRRPEESKQMKRWGREKMIFQATAAQFF